MKIAVFGAQGSGKSTQADLLASHFGLPHIETGDLLRKFGDSQKMSSLRDSLASGQLSPTPLIVRLLRERLAKEDCERGYILDGYPRSIEQYKAFAPELDLVLFVNISDQEAVKRLLKRGREDDSKKAIAERLELYHLETEPVMDIYRQAGILNEANGERSVEEIQKDLVGIIERSLQK